MEMVITKEVFKAQAKKQHAALKDRSVDVKLSDIQESLAIAYGYQNLATLYATFTQEANAVVDARPLLVQKDNLFVVTWMWTPDMGELADHVMAIFPPGTTLNDVSTTNYVKLEALMDRRMVIPEGLVFSEETVVLENYAEVPCIDKYGLHDGANERVATKYFQESLGFRVPSSGVEVSLHDKGDDGASTDNLLIWLNDEDSAKVRALFNE